MATDELSLTLESSDFSCDRIRVHTFVGREAMSQLFELDLEIVCLDHDGPSPDTMTGARVTLIIDRSPGPRAGWHGTHRLHGVVAEVEDLLAGHADLRVYHLRVVPQAYSLALVETQDIFMDLTVPALIERKLAAVGLDDTSAMRVRADYPARDFVVQYKETDLTFVSRLAEHLGISFFFEHGDDAATLIFTDNPGGFARNPDQEAFVFRPRGEEQDVFALSAKRRMIPSYYAVRDYNYRTPAVDLTAEHSLSDAAPGGVIEYGTHHKTPDEGLVLARIRAEERHATQLVYTGRSAIPVLAAGLRCTLDGHPDLGSIDLLIIEVEHRAMQVVAGIGHQGQPGYTNTFRAIPADRMFRPARVTKKPCIAGLVTGIIDAGPAGGAPKYAQLDAQGRYTAHFLFDTTAPGERPASRPIRMVQNHVGENYGTHFPLKPGIEVVIGFIDGDPDRPLIVGAVSNPTKPNPVTNANPGIHRVKTSTGIQVDMAE